MNTIDSVPQSDANGLPKTWRLLGTILWGIGIALTYLVVQTATTLVLVLRGQDILNKQEVLGLLEAAQANGLVLSVSTLVTTLVCTPLIIGVAKLKRGSSIKDYLALRSVSAKTLMSWLGLLMVFIALSDGLTVLLGRPLVPEYTAIAYSSAHPVWLLWLALVVAAPLMEETFFRGFLFRGIASSFVGPVGAIVITSLLWAVIHYQYDLYGIGTIFLLGLLFGSARLLSGSLAVPMTLHAVSNIVATVEAALLG
jgi:membrane protease YdiL (CAAX protease family)